MTEKKPKQKKPKKNTVKIPFDDLVGTLLEVPHKKLPPKKGKSSKEGA